MRFSARITTVIIAMLFAAFLGLCGCSRRAESSPDIPPHLIETPESSPARPINSRPERALSALPSGGAPLGSAQYRARVNELYSMVVYDGVKPIFGDNDPVEQVYAAALALLDRYMLNAWQTEPSGQFNTVHAIHDILVSGVHYDFDLYSSYQAGNTELGDNPAFHIDGVLLNNVAVCDGLARAFNFLCAIEGIEAVRVTGTFSASLHAWNKVKIDGEWYNVDVTADTAYYTFGDNVYRKQLSHGYFLLSDKTLAEFKPNGHVFSDSPYRANDDFDYYADKTVNIGGVEYAATVKSADELNAIFAAVNGQNGGVGKIELKLDFPGKALVNRIDGYENEIAAAYAQIDSPDFSSTSGNAKPYFRYPNGVYLFLIYK